MADGLHAGSLGRDGHSAAVSAIAVAPGPWRLISGSYDRTIRIWDLKNGRVERVLRGHRRMLATIALSPDDQFAYSADWGGTVKVWEIDTGRLMGSVRVHQGMPTSMRLAERCSIGVMGFSDGSLVVWDYVSLRRVTSFIAESPMRSCAIAPDGRTVIAGEESGRLHFMAVEGI